MVDCHKPFLLCTLHIRFNRSVLDSVKALALKTMEDDTYVRWKRENPDCKKRDVDASQVRLSSPPAASSSSSPIIPSSPTELDISAAELAALVTPTSSAKSHPVDQNDVAPRACATTLTSFQEHKNEVVVSFDDSPSPNEGLSADFGNRSQENVIAAPLQAEEHELRDDQGEEPSLRKDTEEDLSHMSV